MALENNPSLKQRGGLGLHACLIPPLFVEVHVINVCSMDIDCADSVVSLFFLLSSVINIRLLDTNNQFAYILE